MARNKTSFTPAAALTSTTVEIYSEEYFAKTLNGTTQSSSRNMTITRTAVGRWTVSLAIAHPEGINYHPSVQVEEQSANRDGIFAHIVQGSLTATGFNLELYTGDNGGTEDVYVDTPFTIGIDSPVTVIANVRI
jgi:hypothetical protein